MKIRKFLFSIAVILCFLTVSFGQQVSNKLDYPCPFSTKRAVIQFTSTGSINLIPCPNKTVEITGLSGVTSVLTSIQTANSSTITFSGNGTATNPLTATALFPNANATTTGLLTSANFTTFNNGAVLANSALQTVHTLNSPTINFSGIGTLASPLTASVNLPTANTSTTGLLSSTDWTIFNNSVTKANNAVDKTCSGSGVLVAGTTAISNSCVTASSKVFIQITTPGGTQGFISVSPIGAASFTVNSTSNTETSSFVWLAVN